MHTIMHQSSFQAGLFEDGNGNMLGFVLLVLDLEEDGGPEVLRVVEQELNFISFSKSGFVAFDKSTDCAIDFKFRAASKRVFGRKKVELDAESFMKDCSVVSLAGIKRKPRSKPEVLCS